MWYREASNLHATIKENLKRQIMVKDTVEGGLNMVNDTLIQKQMAFTWITRVCNGERGTLIFLAHNFLRSPADGTSVLLSIALATSKILRFD